MVDKSGGKVLARKEESKVETVVMKQLTGNFLPQTIVNMKNGGYLKAWKPEQKKEMNTQGRNALNSVRIKGKRA